MTSTCTVFTPGGPVTDPNTGEVTATPGAPVYSGKCRVRPAGTQGSTLTVGGAEAYTFDYVISVPFSATAVTEGQRLTVTASPDPALVGITVKIEKTLRGEHLTARRLACTEVV